MYANNFNQIESFVKACQDTLYSLAGARALDYLHSKRGLNDETILAARLGYNPTSCSVGPGRALCDRGIVIPWTDGGTIYRLNVRRNRPGAKYSTAQIQHGGGFYLSDWLANRPTVFVCGGEFDALLLWQHVRDWADVVTLGRVTARPQVTRPAPGKTFVLATRPGVEGERVADLWRGLVGADRCTRAIPGHGDVTESWQLGTDLYKWSAQWRPGPAPSVTTPGVAVPIEPGPTPTVTTSTARTGPQFVRQLQLEDLCNIDPARVVGSEWPTGSPCPVVYTR